MKLFYFEASNHLRLATDDSTRRTAEQARNMLSSRACSAL